MEEEETVDSTPEIVEQAAPVFNEQKVAQYLERLKTEQNLPLGIVGAAIAALIGALLWAVITNATGYQIGYVAIAIGFIVGFANRTLGKGLDPIFGIVGALFAFFGCFFGNYLSLVGLAADSMAITYMEALTTFDSALVLEAMMDDFGLFDIVFYGIAIYEGYKFSFRQIDEEEMIANAQ
ncbi:MAG: hypothetical protein WBA74_17630 [Cyclobacteriaceae bacterium]